MCACDFPEPFPSAPYPPFGRSLDEPRRPESLDGEAGFVDLFMRGTSCAICRGREIGGREKGRARGVTGLGGFVKAMHCKELTTTVPSLSPSCRPLSLSSLSLSLSLLSSRDFLSVPLFDSSSLHLVLVAPLPSFLSLPSLFLSRCPLSSPPPRSIFLFLILRFLVGPSRFIIASSLLLSFRTYLSILRLFCPSCPPISSFLCRPLARGGRVGARSLLVHHS